MSLPFSLIICTYMRPEALARLLDSVKKQTLYPNEILVIDASEDDEIKHIHLESEYECLKYFKVGNAVRGLTKQRNFGIEKKSKTSKIICFLDDDVILEPDYFKYLIETYEVFPEALAVGGYITNEVIWEPTDKRNDNTKFYYDGWMRNEPLRFRIRKKVGLSPDTPPGFLPTFAHGRSVSFLPPSNKTYQVEQIMGGVSSYREHIFSQIKFSTYFDGYGLYEDTDFSLRISKLGKLYVNSKARLAHYHDNSGRPIYFKYGKMVIRNGWYVWRVKYPKPSLKAGFKWISTSLLLTFIRGVNIINTKQRRQAFFETLGRLYGIVTLIFSTPKPNVNE